MTRINCVPPEELSRQHLLAEYRELPRVFGLAMRAYRSGKKIMAPAAYTLGAGHVKFFYQRLGYCSRRFFQLKAEMLRRGYKPAYDYPPLVEVGTEWFRDWEPDPIALSLNRQRILERTTTR
jgi:deoxyribonuclease (pyrimidine dimer)